MRLPLIVAVTIASVTGAAAQNILPRTTYFTDSYGNISGSATTNPMTGQTVLNNQYGGYEGTINRTGPNQHSITNADGDYMGSINGPMFGNE